MGKMDQQKIAYLLRTAVGIKKSTEFEWIQLKNFGKNCLPRRWVNIVSKMGYLHYTD